MNVEPSDSEERTGPWAYSLTTLLRVISITAGGLGWLLMLSKASPDQVMIALGAIGGVLGVIVGWRRDGSGFEKLKATAGFWAGTLAVAFYSALAAYTFQWSPRNPDGHEVELEGVAFGTSLALLVPIMFVIVLFMARSWTWSAHDAAARK